MRGGTIMNPDAIAIIVWLVLFVVLIIFELVTMGLTTIWFAGGALVALLVALLKGPIPLQIGAFIVVSVILLLALRPFASKVINSRTHKTNVDAVIGKTARVTSDIDNFEGKGSAILNGQEWTARSKDDKVLIPEGTMVVIREVRGVKLIVEPVVT